MKTASEWVTWIKIGEMPWLVPSNKVAEIISDLAAMEKLAIGGDGTTHYYYKDVVEDLQSRLDEAIKKLEYIESLAEHPIPSLVTYKIEEIAHEAISKAKAGDGR